MPAPSSYQNRSTSWKPFQHCHACMKIKINKKENRYRISIAYMDRGGLIKKAGQHKQLFAQKGSFQSHKTVLTGASITMIHSWIHSAYIDESLTFETFPKTNYKVFIISCNAEWHWQIVFTSSLIRPYVHLRTFVSRPLFTWLEKLLGCRSADPRCWRISYASSTCSLLG